MGGTRKQMALTGEGVQPVGQTAGAAGGRKRIAVAVSRRMVTSRVDETASFKQLLQGAHCGRLRREGYRTSKLSSFVIHGGDALLRFL